MWQNENPNDPEPRRVQTLVRSIVQSVPAAANDALTALLVAGAAWLAMMVLPQFAAPAGSIDALLSKAIVNENSAYCDKWGLTPGSPNHALCIFDLDRIRGNEQLQLLQRIGTFN
jgi:hypothetical protein